VDSTHTKYDSRPKNPHPDAFMHISSLETDGSGARWVPHSTCVATLTSEGGCPAETELTASSSVDIRSRLVYNCNRMK